MIDIKALKRAMKAKGLTQKQTAELIGISERTLSRRFQDGEFYYGEMNVLKDVLGLTDPGAIFFAKEISA